MKDTWQSGRAGTMQVSPEQRPLHLILCHLISGLPVSYGLESLPNRRIILICFDVLQFIVRIVETLFVTPFFLYLVSEYVIYTDANDRSTVFHPAT